MKFFIIIFPNKKKYFWTIQKQKTESGCGFCMREMNPSKFRRRPHAGGPQQILINKFADKFFFEVAVIHLHSRCRFSHLAFCGPKNEGFTLMG
jgi:hypothetical protein